MYFSLGSDQENVFFQTFILVGQIILIVISWHEAVRMSRTDHKRV